jgi:hypothetical protein
MSKGLGCLAAVVVLVRWADVWSAVADIFVLPWLVPAVIAGSMLLMAVLLSLWRLVLLLAFQRQ